MAKRRPRQYFEPSTIIALLKREEVGDDRRWWHVQQLLEQGKAGDVEICVSGLALAEVTGGKGKSAGIVVPAEVKDVRAVVRAFFENDYIEIVEAGRVVGELAQQLIWDFPTLNAFDATHLASALDGDCDVLYTYDSDLLRLARASGQLSLAGNLDARNMAARDEIHILRPYWDTPIQATLPDTGPTH